MQFIAGYLIEPTQKLLTLLGSSMAGGNRDIGNGIFAHEDGQHVDYRLTLFNGRWIIQDATPNINDTWLTLIFRRW